MWRCRDVQVRRSNLDVRFTRRVWHFLLAWRRGRDEAPEQEPPSMELKRSAAAGQDMAVTPPEASEVSATCAIVGQGVPVNLVSRHNAEVTALCRRFGVRRLELFGSVATGQDAPTENDVDFLVEFETLPDGTYADAYFGLLESLETLLQRPVDLVVATAITNPYFRQSVDETKTLVYAA